LKKSEEKLMGIFEVNEKKERLGFVEVI